MNRSLRWKSRKWSTVQNVQKVVDAPVVEVVDLVVVVPVHEVINKIVEVPKDSEDPRRS